MTLELLKASVNDPTLRRRIVLNYEGGYSLRIGLADEEFVLKLHVEPGTPHNFPYVVDVAGEVVRVIASDDFVAPVALKAA